MKYSIITINYNNKDGLRKTIESVINQTCNDFEYIIIDGGSTDGSVDVIKEYADKIDYWVSEPDKGIYNAMNKGVKVAKGEYLNFMNSGDCFYNDNILCDVEHNLLYDIIVGKTISDTNILIGYNKENIGLIELFSGTLPHQASFVKRVIFNKRIFDEKYNIVSDWKFYIETLVIDNCSFYNIENIICLFDMNGISLTNVELRNNERKAVLNELFPERILNDYFYFTLTKSSLQELAPLFNKTYRFEKMIYSVVKLLINIRYLGRKKC